MSSDRDRQRRHRERERAGKILVAVEADAVALADLLIAARLLNPLRADDPRAIADATERLLATLAAEHDGHM